MPIHILKKNCKLSAMKPKLKSSRFYTEIIGRIRQLADPPKWDGRQPLRFKSEPKNYSWQDAVMGQLDSGEEAIDDFIIIKADGYPTYNFAHIVDDALMKISHVIRSQEFISSVPKYLNLYEALELEPPILATLPYVMAIDGKKKLSKRDGAKDILDYAREGYLPEAMINFLATLGWNDGTEQEVFSVQELTEKFSLERVQKSSSRFDEQRLAWLNGQWIRKTSLDELYARTLSQPLPEEETKGEAQAHSAEAVSLEGRVDETAMGFWPNEAEEASEEYKKKVLALVQDRLKTLSDLPQATRYFFAEPERDESLIENNKQLKKLSPERRQELVKLAERALEKSEFTPGSIQETLNKLLETTGEKPAVLFSLIRVYTTWAPFSPQLNETLALLGRDKVLKRLN